MAWIAGTIKNNIYVYLKLNVHSNCTGSRVRRGHKLNLILLPLILNFIGNYSLILLLGIKNKLLALIIIKSHQQIEQAMHKNFDSNWTFIKHEKSLLAIAMALTVELWK